MKNFEFAADELHTISDECSKCLPTEDCTLCSFYGRSMVLEEHFEAWQEHADELARL